MQYFRVSVDGYDGNWSDARVGATWMFSRHFGAGLGYDHFATRTSLERPASTAGCESATEACRPS